MSSLVCRICNAVVELPEDGPEARKAGTDPYQTMRRHLENHPTSDKMTANLRALSWLIDLLMFKPAPDESGQRSMKELNVYRANLYRIADYYSAQEDYKDPE